LEACKKLLKELKKDPNAGWFNVPVDPVALNLWDYKDIITRPMDLGTVSVRSNTNTHSF